MGGNSVIKLVGRGGLKIHAALLLAPFLPIPAQLGGRALLSFFLMLTYSHTGHIKRDHVFVLQPDVYVFLHLASHCQCLTETPPKLTQHTSNSFYWMAENITWCKYSVSQPFSMMDIHFQHFASKMVQETILFLRLYIHFYF
jgi:hypothetical protein